MFFIWVFSNLDHTYSFILFERYKLFFTFLYINLPKIHLMYLFNIYSYCSFSDVLSFSFVVEYFGIRKLKHTFDNFNQGFKIFNNYIFFRVHLLMMILFLNWVLLTTLLFVVFILTMFRLC
jgi:hypothetical protein